MGRIIVYCLPGAKQTQCVGLHDGKPKIQLKAPTVGGTANTPSWGFGPQQGRRSGRR